jgi:hypothetical protein
MKQLREVSEILEQQILKLQYLHAVRWLASKVGALNAPVTDFKSNTVEPLFYIFEGTKQKWCTLWEMVYLTIYVTCNLQNSLPFYFQVLVFIK